MEKELNSVRLQEAAEAKGLNQTAIAGALGVTRASVSKWFTGKSFPRPAELLKLGRLLALRHMEMVSRAIPGDEPVVAFRKRGSCKTTDEHIERAKDMGRFLKPLVGYVDVDEFIGPPSLKHPSCNYRYVQDLAARIRRDLNIAEKAAFHFTDLIKLFRDHQAVIIPTLWGRKARHENAIHIHLPESQTTWIYLNLDVEVHDFKFWMAHELAHVLTLDLLRENRIEEAEDFADAFAGALVFPEPLAEGAYGEYKTCRTEQRRLNVLGKWAEEHIISPLSVYKEIENFATASKAPFTPLSDAALFAFIAAFNKRYPTLGESFFDHKTPTADQFMRVVQEAFETKVFSALGQYVREKKPAAGAIATILGVSRMDALGYLEALSR